MTRWEGDAEDALCDTSPMSNVAIRDVLVAPPTDLPKESLGFQGLFADRHALATTPAPGETALESPLEPGATVIYLTRNRAYSPELGRFLSRDPNEAAMPVVSALLMNGEAVALALGAFNPNAHYGDGMNLYEFGRSDPVNMRDPLGLNAVDDDIDALIGAIAGERAAAASAIAARVGQVVNTAVRVGSTLLSLVPGGDAVKLMYLLASGEPVTMDDVASAAFSLIPGGGVIGKIAGKAIGTLSKMLWPYFKKVGAKLVKFGGDFVRRVASRFQRADGVGGVVAQCLRRSSFVVGTLVASETGMVPIESINVGDKLVTKWEHNASEATCHRAVSAVFSRLAPIVAYVTLENGQELGLTPEHPVWNATIDRWMPIQECAVGDELLDVSAQRLAIILIRYDNSPHLVYNYEVEGTHTYFAEGVWVHNCLPPLPRGSRGEWRGVIDGTLFKADYVRDGSVLQLNNVGVKGESGIAAFLGVLEQVKDVARKEGFRQIHIFAVRRTGASPGTIIDRVIDLY